MDTALDEEFRYPFHKETPRTRHFEIKSFGVHQYVSQSTQFDSFLAAFSNFVLSFLNTSCYIWHGRGGSHDLCWKLWKMVKNLYHVTFYMVSLPLSLCRHSIVFVIRVAKQERCWRIFLWRIESSVKFVCKYNIVLRRNLSGMEENSILFFFWEVCFAKYVCVICVSLNCVGTERFFWESENIIELGFFCFVNNNFL